MEANVQKLKDLLSSYGYDTLDRDKLLQILIQIDPGQALWTPENIDDALELAAPGCRGQITCEQFLCWLFSSGPCQECCNNDVCTDSDQAAVRISDLADAIQNTPDQASKDESCGKRPGALEPGWVHTGEVLVHGSGDCGQLGLGANTDLREEFQQIRRKPFSVQPLHGKGVCRVCAGALHSAALTATGEVWTWGCNDAGALGRCTGEDSVCSEDVPGQVTGLRISWFSAAPIVHEISCGDSHMAALDSMGRVWCWGSYSRGSSMQDAAEAAAFEPKVVKLPAMAQSIACGAEHTLAQVSSQVLGWGSNECGQLPWATDLSCCSTERVAQKAAKALLPRLYHHLAARAGLVTGREPLLLTDVSRRVQLGTYAVSYGTYVTVRPHESSESCCRLFGAGLNNKGQLGIGESTPQEASNSSFLHSWFAVTALNGISLRQVTGGSLHTAALSSSGQVYVWGLRLACKSGKANEALVRPQLLEGLHNVQRLACGDSHTLACLADGSLYTWGLGMTHQLANAPRCLDRETWDTIVDPESGLARWKLPCDELHPYRVDATKLAGQFVLDVSGGAHHSMELVWDGAAVARSVAEETLTPSIFGQSATRVEPLGNDIFVFGAAVGSCSDEHSESASAHEEAAASVAACTDLIAPSTFGLAPAATSTGLFSIEPGKQTKRGGRTQHHWFEKAKGSHHIQKTSERGVKKDMVINNTIKKKRPRHEQ